MKSKKKHLIKAFRCSDETDRQLNEIVKKLRQKMGFMDLNTSQVIRKAIETQYNTTVLKSA